MTNDAKHCRCTRFLHSFTLPPVFIKAVLKVLTKNVNLSKIYWKSNSYFFVIKTLICPVPFCGKTLIHLRWPSSPAMTSTCLRRQGNPSNLISTMQLFLSFCHTQDRSDPQLSWFSSWNWTFSCVTYETEPSGNIMSFNRWATLLKPISLELKPQSFNFF